MRIRNIPRALPSEVSIAEPIELGSGMEDRRAGHSFVAPLNSNQVNDPREMQWFKESEIRDPDPRTARSDYHDPVNFMIDKREKKEFLEVELAEGYIESAIMYPNGAHLYIVNEDESYFTFIENVNFIVTGTKVKVIDKIIKTIYPSGNFNIDEKHSLILIEVEEEQENETIEKE